MFMMSGYSSVDGLMRHGVTVDYDEWLKFSRWPNAILLIMMMSGYSSVDGLMRHGVTVDYDDEWLYNAAQCDC